METVLCREASEQCMRRRLSQQNHLSRKVEACLDQTLGPQRPGRQLETMIGLGTSEDLEMEDLTERRRTN